MMSRFLTVLLLSCLSWSVSATDARITLLGTESVAQLDRMLTHGREAFLPPAHRVAGYQWPGYVRAKYPVRIYRVDYRSAIPELPGKSEEASGLIAIPVVPGATALPLLSYQHGTVFGRYQVPSYAFSKTNPSGYPQYSGAFETRLIVAQYAGQGYVVIAPDYFGLGDSSGPEAYMVKRSEQRACLDLYRAALTFLGTQGLQPSRLFLGGWSQGGLVTTAFLEKLQSLGIKVTAAFTAASPNDPFATLNAWLYHPTASDPVWENAIVALSLFSYQYYDSMPALAKAVLRPKYYVPFKRIYTRDYHSMTDLYAILASLARHRGGLLGYLRPPYANPTYLANSPFGKFLARSETYRELFAAPVRMYYGTRYQVIRVPLARLAARYQRAMGGRSIRVVKVVDANHRGTFLAAASSALAWFNGFR
ncbi:MAG: alpha/beta fold hydrolase [Gallionella sp.]|jgi:pimeloyl-ACP methyl ester carboxylesterase|nr:alpha/beta fold hydrolase [Gallionella sp.]